MKKKREKEAEVDEGEESVLELQSAGMTAVWVRNYSILVSIIKYLSIRTIAVFRPLSVSGHRFLGMEGKEV